MKPSETIPTSKRRVGRTGGNDLGLGEKTIWARLSSIMPAPMVESSGAICPEIPPDFGPT